jgi:hypothetical protein
LWIPFFVWEETLRKLKKVLKEWAKTQTSPPIKRQEAQKNIEDYQLELEGKEITQECLAKEDQLQRTMHQAYREEEGYWQQKSRSLWLEYRDKNTTYFHKQAEARKQFKAIKEIHDQDQVLMDFEDIKKCSIQDFHSSLHGNSIGLPRSEYLPSIPSPKHYPRSYKCKATSASQDTRT